jgi:hypothetical protein
LTRYDIPGAVVAIVRDGEVLLVDGYGMADLDRRVPMNGELTVVRVGSVSKALTSTLALLEVQRGHLGLDQDLRPLLADLPVRPPLASPLTLHQLLTFTGGFNEQLFGQHVRAAGAFSPLARFLRDELPPRFAEPGAVVSYNDFQTSLVGYALERVGNERFETLAARELLGPLGMTSTTFEQVNMPGDLAARTARAYTRRGGRLAAYPRDYISTTPAAGLYTTGGDRGYPREQVEVFGGGAAHKQKGEREEDACPSPNIEPSMAGVHGVRSLLQLRCGDRPCQAHHILNMRGMGKHVNRLRGAERIDAIAAQESTIARLGGGIAADINDSFRDS